MLYSKLIGSSTGVLLRDIPRVCSERLFFLTDLTGLKAFMLGESPTSRVQKTHTKGSLCLLDYLPSFSFSKQLPELRVKQQAASTCFYTAGSGAAKSSQCLLPLEAPNVSIRPGNILTGTKKPKRRFRPSAF